MATTYEPIATTTLGGVSTITFSSIPSTYTDLRLTLNLVPSSTPIPRIQFNSNTASNYSYTTLYGTGSSTASNRTTSNTYLSMSEATQSSSYPAFYTLDIFSYAGSTNKTVLMTANQDANGSGQVQYTVGLWRVTSAINTIYLFPNAFGSFAAGTTATLYGIKAA